MDHKIDFLLMWVDGSDPVCLEEKKKFKPDLDISDSINRYRDWDILKYWFRGIEKFAPWVNNVFFITYGHLPAFLNVNNPKLKIINHKDYIDNKYLPTYNPKVLELNFHNIEDLSEHFVYFNDDMFVIKEVIQSDFFKDGLPCDSFSEDVIYPGIDPFCGTLFKNECILSKYFKKSECKKSLKGKYYNIKYGKNNLKTFVFSYFKNFVGIKYTHLPQSFLKSKFQELYNLEKDTFEKTYSHKFRTETDINQYLIREYQLLSGNFSPRSYKIGKPFIISNNNEKIINSIIKQKYKMICLNDNDPNVDFDKAKRELINAFETILPDKCSFEK